MKNLQACNLYIITGESYHPGRSLTAVIEAALRGGADIVQLRDKSAAAPDLLAKALELRRLTRRYGALFVVNDDIELALATAADGVHLGQDDMPLAEARRIAAGRLFIGISTHNLEQALAAERGGADYIGVGPVYPTPTKPDRPAVTTSFVAEAAAAVGIPFFAIGGISPATADAVLAAGASRLCAVSAVACADDPEAVCAALKRAIKQRTTPGGERAEPAGAVAGARPAEAGGVGAPTERKRTQEQTQTQAQVVPLLLNGKHTFTTASTLRELAESLGLAGRRVMAERNGAAVPRADWATAHIQADDEIEFVQFVGGG